MMRTETSDFKPAPGDVVKVPFPFTDRQSVKTRPALVLSTGFFNDSTGHTVLAMITSAKHSSWSLDVPITDLQSSGLPSPSLIRMKLFTLDNRLILARLGRLSEADAASLKSALARLIPG